MPSKVMFASARTAPSRESGSTDDWGTPQKFYDLLHEEFNFQLDPCAASAEVSKCDSFITPEVDGLATSWERMTAFVNFPYSQAKAWARKCVLEAARGSTVVVLCAARTDTEWFHLLAAQANEVRFLRGRLAFVGPVGVKQSAPFPSAVIVLDAQKQLDESRMRMWSLPAEARR